MILIFKLWLNEPFFIIRAMFTDAYVHRTPLETLCENARKNGLSNHDIYELKARRRRLRNRVSARICASNKRERLAKLGREVETLRRQNEKLKTENSDLRRTQARSKKQNESLIEQLATLRQALETVQKRTHGSQGKFGGKVGSYLSRDGAVIANRFLQIKKKVCY
jgi:DNA repair exonuclease SbcCD ATPase subunit